MKLKLTLIAIAILAAAILPFAQTINNNTGGGGAGAGTVTVVGSGNLTSGQLMTGGGSQTAQTPSSNATCDSSGNCAFNGVTTGQSSGNTGFYLWQGHTSGSSGFSVPDVSDSNKTLYLLPAAPSSGSVLTDGGIATCPTYTGGGATAPSTHCEALAWGAGGGGGGTAVQVGTIESLPSCTTTAFLYVITDSAYTQAFCNGVSAYTYFVNGQAVTPPTGTCSWTNQVSATVTTQTNGVWSFDFPSHGATSNAINACTLATPSVPFTQVYRASFVQQNLSGDGDEGFVLRESATGKLITVGIHTNTGTCATGPCFVVSTWTNTTTFSAQVGVQSTGQMVAGLSFNPATIKIAVASGSTGAITISWSPDGGITYVQLYSVAKNTFFTTAPDQIGFYGNNNTSGAKDIYLTAISIN